MNSTNQGIIVPIGKDAHYIAKAFAREQKTQAKKKQVYLNTLAVYAVHTYLGWIEIESDLEQGDSFQPGIRGLLNVADLVLPGIGRLECYPILPNEELYPLSVEARYDRIGCVAVQFTQHLDQVELLGFIPAEPAIELPENIRLAELGSLDNLIAHIDWIESGKIVQLRQWLRETYEPGWQEPARLISVTRFRDSTYYGQSINRAKQIDYEFDEQPVALLVQLTSTTTEDFKICVRLCPTISSYSNCLPKGIQLLVIDDNDMICMQRQVEEVDSWVEHEFTGKPGEQFSIRIVLKNLIFSENFMI
ncbi:DUF1822 family protein [Aetokthonos hydrillicola Thurmond2011]|jgi:hypothetical protein|uniref:DUF1822 family protein n=1 Tax=Aetokthonos hydrillicola Thurmond2011 TaxID=2712845 RepID=A0AAP5IF72_9CYAN|nr:DUF1822 family protein [Aetokthonos hydrillicola]MBO3463369.1 DUF1822 family protein [Aetokthonos hydrillicola CCALA 1050]MBW4590504.1 DUF1822 family protein [Aetokthonos hydrillicola CCALA 1050]MDR9899022.1 DUF1822 family protein [Aetokthonos hydrillicola Thurmond2011]